MQIHELNTFGGTLGTNDFFATDNGTDTSKVSAEAMLAPLNARIDNIIAGPASSAEEVIDARLGANGVVYASLGDAIREQIADLETDLGTYTDNLFDLSPFEAHNWVKNGQEVVGQPKDLQGVRFADDYAFKANTSYSLQLWAYTEGNVSSGTENGLRVRVYYTDGSNKQLNYPNSISGFVYGAIITDAAKTVNYVEFYYINQGANIWHIKNIMLNEGEPAEEFNAYLSGIDTEARNLIERRTSTASLSALDISNKFVWGDMPFTLNYAGWVLDGTGTSKRDANGSMYQCEVSEGQVLWIIADRYSDAGVYQFQSGSNVNGSGKANALLVGKPAITNTDAIVVVPRGATHLIITRPTADPTDFIRVGLFESKGGVLPKYWQKYIFDKAAEISKEAAPPVGSGVRFAFITDVHLRNADGTLRNAGWSPLLLKYLHEHCNIGTAFFGGDTLTGGYTDLDAAVKDLDLFRDTFSEVWSWMYSIFGNHEYGNNASDLSPLDKSVIYNALIRDKEKQYASLNPIYGSYVLDDKAEKVRFICLNLNEGNNLTQQNDFFCNAMLETPAGWTIIYLTHFSLEKVGGVDQIATKLTNANSIIPAIEAYNARQVYGNFDFTNAEAEVACVIGGHSHYDGMVKTSGGVPVISTTCDMYAGISGMTAGTTTEQAFDIFTINTSAKTIGAKRIGFGEDRSFTYGN